MLPIRILTLCLMLSGVCEAAEGMASAHKQLQEYLNTPSEPGDVFTQAKLDQVEYRILLAGAISRQADSLAALFRYTANGNLMGEGAETNCDILRQLLILWGDRQYAEVLRKQPLKIRIAVISALDYAWPHPGWEASNYPETYQLAPHENKKS